MRSAPGENRISATFCENGELLTNRTPERLLWSEGWWFRIVAAPAIWHSSDRFDRAGKSAQACSRSPWRWFWRAQPQHSRSCFRMARVCLGVAFLPHSDIDQT